MGEELKAQTQSMGLNYDEVLAGLRRILPLLEVAAKMSENKYDDIAVEFIKKMLAE